MADIVKWTHSRLETFETCPRQYEAKYVLKTIEFQQNAAAIWGDQVHDAFDKRIGKQIPMPTNMKQYEVFAAAAARRSGRKVLEGKFAVDREWQACEYYDNAWWNRGKIDYLSIHGTVADVLDWKTGKKKHAQAQLKLYALYVFAHYPEIQKVRAGYVWLKNREVTPPLVLTRDDIPDLIEEFEARYARLEYAHEVGIFKPQPSGLCRGWCEVTDCEHWRPKPPGRQ